MCSHYDKTVKKYKLKKYYIMKDVGQKYCNMR